MVGFDPEKSLIFGVVQILTGISWLVLGVVALVTKAWGATYGTGFWGGGVSLGAGLFGLAAARLRTNSTVICFMVLSVVGCMMALVSIALSSLGIVADRMMFEDLKMHEGTALVVHSLSIVVSVVEAVCGAMAGVVGCKGVCAPWYSAEYRASPNITPDTGIEQNMPPNTPLPEVHNPELHSLLRPPTRVSVTTDDIHIMRPMSIQTPEPYLSDRSNMENVHPPQGGCVIQSTDSQGGCTQVLYVLPTSGINSCPQPGDVLDDPVERSARTPPPPYHMHTPPDGAVVHYNESFNPGDESVISGILEHSDDENDSDSQSNIPVRTDNLDGQNLLLIQYYSATQFRPQSESSSTSNVPTSPSGDQNRTPVTSNPERNSTEDNCDIHESSRRDRTRSTSDVENNGARLDITRNTSGRVSGRRAQRWTIMGPSGSTTIMGPQGSRTVVRGRTDDEQNIEFSFIPRHTDI